MKVAVVILAFAFYSVECGRLVKLQPADNINFINMEAGAHTRNAPLPAPAKPNNPPSPTQSKAPAPVTTPKTAPAPVVAPKPVVTVAPKPAQPQQPKINQGLPPPSQKPVAIQPQPGGSTITTPGPGSVKQLVNFYDSQGKASPIRPYSYSDAVKKGH